MLKERMIFKGCTALLAFGVCLALSMVAPVSAASDSSGVQKMQSVKTSEVTSERKKSDFVGSWTCSTRLTNKDPGGRGEMTMTATEEQVATADGKSRGTGKMQFKLVMKKDDKVMELNARWNTRGAYSWRLKDGELCQTVNELTIQPANDDARKMEERMGKSMEDNIPKGEEMCSEIVESSRDEYVTKDPQSGAVGRCKRK